MNIDPPTEPEWKTRGEREADLRGADQMLAALDWLDRQEMPNAN